MCDFVLHTLFLFEEYLIVAKIIIKREKKFSRNIETHQVYLANEFVGELKMAVLLKPKQMPVTTF